MQQMGCLAVPDTMVTQRQWDTHMHWSAHEQVCRLGRELDIAPLVHSAEDIVIRQVSSSL